MKDERGVSLIESLLVIVILGSLVFLMANIPNALILMTKSKHLSLAREIAAKQIEDTRMVDYISLSLGSSAIVDSRLSFLPQGSGTVIVGVRNEATEDPDDWIICDPSVCTDEEELKQIKVTVNWVDNNKPQVLTLDTIAAPGGINQ